MRCATFQRDLNVTKDEFQAKAELGGLTDPDGQLSGGSPPTGSLFVPVVIRLEGDSLVWREFSQDSSGFPPLRDAKGALDRFVRIKQADDVLAFARRYGPLQLCGHGKPASHGGEDEEGRLLKCRPSRREPVDRWLFYVANARAILKIASAMRQGILAERRDWDELYRSRRTEAGTFGGAEQTLRNLSGQGLPVPRDMVASLQWLHLSNVVNYWVNVSNVRPEVSRSWTGKDSAPGIELVGVGIFGALAVQLLAAIAGAHGTYFCCGCGDPYRASRRPRTGQRHFCRKEECKRAGTRERQSAHRARVS
jgi:hypothetical protein